MAEGTNSKKISSALPNRTPYAMATLQGSASSPHVRGTVQFFTAPGGTIIDATLNGLPDITLPTDNPQIGPFGFHVHEGASCTPTDGENPFSNAGEHYNPMARPHPLHAGDLPVLFPNDGTAHMQVYTNRFTPKEVIGRTIVVHQSPDDFRTQPGGDSGKRMACGTIQAL